MADVSGTVEFKALVAKTSAVLLTRGLDVEPVGLRNVTAYLVNKLSADTGMDAEEAVHLAEPEMIAEMIQSASDRTADGSQNAHSVRPVRTETRRARLPAQAVGRLVMAASQVGKYASCNGDDRLANEAMDLACELGAALTEQESAEPPRVEAGLLIELAQLAEAVAGHIEDDGWSICPCGEEHGQRDLDVKVSQTMRADAEMGRSLSREDT